MTVKITKPALNLREELASLRNQGGAYEESKFYLDNLVTNGDFSNGTTGWAAAGSGATIAEVNNELVVTRNGTSGYAKQTFNTVAGQWYKVTYTVVSMSHSHRVTCNSAGLAISSATGTFSFDFKADEGTEELRLHCFNSSTATVTFDNISVHEVAPNLVTNGTFDYDGGWTVGAGWTISGGQAVATNVVSGSAIKQNITISVAGTYTLSVDMVDTASTYSVSCGSMQGTAAINTTGVVTLTGYLPAGTHEVYVGAWSSGFSGTADNIIVTQGNHHLIHSTPYGYEVKDVYIDGDLAREGEAYDYTVHDGFIQPTIEPTASTETVVIGVRK